MKPQDKNIDLILRDGTSQEQRFLTALDPDSIPIDERNLNDFLKFIFQFAGEINFYGANNMIDGDWQVFFSTFSDPLKYESLIRDWMITREAKAHHALPIAFYKLFAYANENLNQITGKHLRFFFQDLLKIKSRAAEADKVHLLLELSRTVDNHKLEGSTRFLAGKDPGGKTIFYVTDKEYILNKATIASVKSLFIDTAGDHTIYAAPVANSADGLGKPFEKGIAQWSPFGKNQKDLTDQEMTMETATTGFAIASPLLLLKEGTRVITLLFEIKDISGTLTASSISDNLDIYLSGEKEWIAPENFSAQVTGITPALELEIVITLPIHQPAIVPYNSALLGDPFVTEWPIVKIVLNTAAWKYLSFAPLQVTSLTINVSVSGMKDLIVQNEQGVQDASKPFFPFGPSPHKGSSFYLGSDEIFQKKPDNIDLQFTYTNLPADLTGFQDYYAGYSGAVYTNSIFLAGISILDKRLWVPLLIPSVFQLFDSELSGALKITSPDQPLQMNLLNLGRDPHNEPFSAFTGKENRGFLKLELQSPDFGHSEYPRLYTQKVLEKALNPSDTSIVLPNPPYTPEIQEMSVSYTSSQVIHFNSPNGIEHFFHIEPFGVYEQELNGTVFLIPQFAHQGILYIGLDNFVPPSNISLLFQLAEGSGDPLQALERDNIEWSYLSQDQWVIIEKLEIIAETTSGFQTSGIIELTIGSDASSDNSLLPSGLHWLRARVITKAEGSNKIINLHTQAIEASRVLENSTPASPIFLFDAPLPPGTITKMAVRDASVKKIEQPYSSFNIKPGEVDNGYFARVSERLRHKNRALNLWDYEHLVLEEFPDIYKVKCLNHTDSQNNLAMGTITLITIPNIKNKNSGNPLEPKTSTITLSRINDYIRQLTSPFVKVTAENPVYEKILIHFKVGFYAGYDPGFYGLLLQEEIRKFLSPWAYEEGDDIIIGGKIYKAAILTFVENREYVDFVNDFRLYHVHSGPVYGGIGDMAIGVDFIVRPLKFPGVDQMTLGDDFVVGEDVEVAVASNPKAILASAGEHYITVLKAGEYECTGVEYEGIGFMAVGVDFIIGKYPFAIGSMKIVPFERHSPLTLTLPDDLRVNAVEDLINP